MGNAAFILGSNLESVYDTSLGITPDKIPYPNTWLLKSLAEDKVNVEMGDGFLRTSAYPGVNVDISYTRQFGVVNSALSKTMSMTFSHNQEGENGSVARIVIGDGTRVLDVICDRDGSIAYRNTASDYNTISSGNNFLIPNALKVNFNNTRAEVSFNNVVIYNIPYSSLARASLHTYDGYSWYRNGANFGASTIGIRGYYMDVNFFHAEYFVGEGGSKIRVRNSKFMNNDIFKRNRSLKYLNSEWKRVNL